ncbi:hypothetical protein ACFFHM_02955 [Halalkalibacter kiskunsagensis]|uniref:Uncharacterized protein n=1 Tax=Halalkalibacter kiskunsagensis TaxID=1548599 RepID=A0ABV6K899_9BACI
MTEIKGWIQGIPLKKTVSDMLYAIFKQNSLFKEVKNVEQTDQKLKEAFQNLEEAMSHFQNLLQTVTEEIESNENSNVPKTIKSLKVLLNDKRHILDPAIQFEDIVDHTVCDLSSSIPTGHVVTLYYRKHPIRKQTIYHSEPVNLKPWLAFRLHNLSH